MKLFPFLLKAIFHAIRQIIVVGCGLFFELSMIKFLRKSRAQIMPGQVQLIPWKSEYKNENDITVPLQATMVCLFGLIANNIAAIVTSVGLSQSELKWQLLLSFGNFWVSIQMPLILCLTIRAAKKKKKPPILPIG